MGSPTPSGSATAQAESQNGFGSVMTTAHSPGGGPASATSNASVGAGAATLIAITAGQTVSVAALTPNASTIGVGAMSAGYGGTGETLTYEATADFDFTTVRTGKIYLTLLDSVASGIGFDNLELKIDVNSVISDHVFTSLANAEAFFADNMLDLGLWAAGPQVVDLSYWLTASEPDAGFGFSYNLAVPEAPTWALMLAGFAGLGLAALVRGGRMTRAAQSFAPVAGEGRAA